MHHAKVHVEGSSPFTRSQRSKGQAATRLAFSPFRACGPTRAALGPRVLAWAGRSSPASSACGPCDSEKSSRRRAAEAALRIRAPICAVEAFHSASARLALVRWVPLKVLSYLRWPSSLAALAAVLFTIASQVVSVGVEISFVSSLGLDMGAYQGGSVVVLRDRREFWPGFLYGSLASDWTRFDDWGRWCVTLGSYERTPWWGAKVEFPTWNLALLPASIGALGFWSRRRLSVHPGHCRKCGYEKGDAAICPECGT